MMAFIKEAIAWWPLALLVVTVTAWAGFMLSFGLEIARTVEFALKGGM